MRLSLFILFGVLLLASGCSFMVQGDKDYSVSVKEAEEQVFADCDSFLAYYDSCERFYESVPGSVCEQRYSVTAEGMADISEGDIPASDADCYPLVECNWFNGLGRTKSRLAECRVTGPARPRCIISYDIQCVGFNATREQVVLELKNAMDSNIKQVSLSVNTATGAHLTCRDSDDDGILAKGETDTFVCRSGEGILPLPRTRTLKATLELVFADYTSGAFSTKTGVLEVEV
ncbi:hypothetical protein KY363_03665 [Candidatus Woesearchaeota archaeon]|nr:hypothetical protein [Candidatus Woesearchaeota archaeon]